jgi:signal transduction histidine kinase
MRRAPAVRALPLSYRGRIAVTVALALVVMVGSQAVIRGVINDRVRASAQRTLQTQADALAVAVNAAPDSEKGNRASDARRYLLDTRIEVTWPAPGGFFYNLVPLDRLDLDARATSGAIDVRLRRELAAGGLADWLVVALFFGGILTAAGLVWGLSSAVSRRLRRQVADLASSAEAVASGDLTVRADVPEDELGRAAGAFNRMTERLAEADARQRRFLADVAHELRTPVTAIDGFASALVDGAAATPADRAEAVGFIRDEAARLRELIDDLRELTRLDLDPPVHTASCDIAQLARDSMARFDRVAEDGGVTLVAPTNSVVGVIDVDGLETVLANLIQNALTATPRGGWVQIEVSTYGTWATLRVRDCGIGIDAKHLPYIFDRLYRVDSARSRDAGGSGLGLAIVKQAVEGMGGTVAVDSAPGAGSTFTIRLPIAPRDS